jgi:hypothetical protein
MDDGEIRPSGASVFVERRKIMIVSQNFNLDVNRNRPLHTYFHSRSSTNRSLRNTNASSLHTGPGILCCSCCWSSELVFRSSELIFHPWQNQIDTPSSSLIRVRWTPDRGIATPAVLLAMPSCCCTTEPFIKQLYMNKQLKSLAFLVRSFGRWAHL